MKTMHTLNMLVTMYVSTVIAVFTHGPQGLGPRAANFQGRHIKKKIEIEIGYAEKKRLSTREKFKGDLY